MFSYKINLPKITDSPIFQSTVLLSLTLFAIFLYILHLKYSIRLYSYRILLPFVLFFSNSLLLWTVYPRCISLSLINILLLNISMSLVILLIMPHNNMAYTYFCILLNIIMIYLHTALILGMVASILIPWSLCIGIPFGSLLIEERWTRELKDNEKLKLDFEKIKGYHFKELLDYLYRVRRVILLQIKYGNMMRNVDIGRCYADLEDINLEIRELETNGVYFNLTRQN